MKRESEKRCRSLLAVALASALAAVPALGAEGERSPLPVGNGEERPVALAALLGVADGEEPREVTAPVYPEVRYEVEFLTSDDHLIRGTFLPTPIRQRAPVVILVPSIDFTREAYSGLASRLAQEGFSVLSIDLRGYGDSTAGPGGRTIDGPALDRAREWDFFRDMPLDVEAAIRWVRTSGVSGGGGIYLIGTQVGGTVGVLGMMRRGAGINGAVLVHPAMRFRGLSIFDELGNIQGRPVMVMVSREDGGALSTLRRAQETNRNVIPGIVPGYHEGRALLENEEGFEMTLEFLRQMTE